ncbi:MAG: sigma-70 family RNA polymerase sigma factor [Oscillospiraceae bacterium]|nr:sigma-70 family RNA polymerase sigma factor [Oscillospiraceae bacterium]
METDFEAVVERYTAPLYRLAYSYCGSREDAEDVLQETFLRYLSKRPRFSAEEQRRAWLMTVAANCCRDLLRRRARRAVVPLDETLAAPETERHPEVAAALAALPPKDRAMVYLFYYESLPTRQIARMLGMTDSAVRTHLTRARGKLRTILGGNADAEG